MGVLTHGFWRERLGADSAIVGRTILLNRQPFTVVGVARPDFNGHIAVVHADVFVPITMMPVAQPGFRALSEPYASWLMALARLRSFILGVPPADPLAVAGAPLILLGGRAPRLLGACEPGRRRRAGAGLARGVIIPRTFTGATSWRAHPPPCSSWARRHHRSR